MLKRLLHPTNRRIRLLVGLMLGGMFLIHASQGQANRAPSEVAHVIDGKQIGHTSGRLLADLEQMAQEDQIALLEMCLDHCLKGFADYTCTLVKQERINGRLGLEQVVDVTFRHNPYSVGMKWLKNAGRGDRVRYVEGEYGGDMLVRPSGSLARMIVPTAKRKCDGDEAMRSTLRPVNQFGFARGLESLIDVYKLARERGELDFEFGGYAEVAGRKTIVLVRRLPDTPEYRRTAAPLTKTYVDLDYLVPVMVEGFGPDGREFLCRYLYKDIRFNLGLTDKDFQLGRFDLVEP